MAISYDFDIFPAPVIFTIVAAAIGIIIIFLFISPSPSNSNAPKQITGGYPLVGTYEFFIARWDFFRKSRLLTSSGNFTFFLGPHQVIGLSGDKSRATFFENRDLNFAEGYATLLGSSPTTINDRLRDNDDPDTKNYFSRRLIWLLRGERFGRRLPKMINDVQTELNKLGDEAPGITDPFHHLGHIVALLTMRAIGCDDIADDPVLLEKSVQWYLDIKNSATPMTIMYPWFPTPSIFSRTRAGYNLYMTIDKIVKERERTSKKGDDPLQHLLDEGDGMMKIISFIIGALFAGLENSAINIPWVLIYLSQSPHWLSLARSEILSVCAKHHPSSPLPILTQLSLLPVEIWESSFPILDLCLKECMRIQLLGTGYRKNVSGKDLKIGVGNEVIPNGALVAYHFSDVHRDEEVYPEPEKWDPGRYLEGREEDKKKPYAYIGWGAGLHPCLGMRFAKMENSLILAFFLTMFDFELVDKSGIPAKELPAVDLNNIASTKPKTKVYLKYTRRT